MSGRLDELEGLRGALALWVVAYHVVAICELHLPLGLAQITDGGHAVDVFIILSGFVIASLRQNSTENYATYLARRWFRLFPIYFVCVAAAIGLASIGIMPFRFTQNDFPWLLAIHAMLLQGAVPGASFAFLNPTWSVSLEWQFYLVAPLLVSAMARSPTSLMVVSLIVAVVTRLIPPLSGVIGALSGGFLLAKVHLFWIGIASFLWYRQILNHRNIGYATAILAATLVIASFAISLQTFIGLVIWAIVFSVVVGARTASAEMWATKTRSVMSSKTALLIGSISYPIYLCHEPIVWLARWLTLTLCPNISKAWLVALVAVIVFPTTIVIGIVLHQFVERPFIAWAKRLGKRSAAAGMQ